MATNRLGSTDQIIYADDITPLDDDILVIGMEDGDKVTKSGIIITNDNGKLRGIRPRWCEVYKVGKNVTDVSVGEWILVEHGRWTYAFNFVCDGVKLRLQKVLPDYIMMASPTKPNIL